MKKTLLVIEDDIILAELLLKNLHNSGFDTIHLKKGIDVKKIIQEKQIKLILLDLTLPGIDGVSLCKNIRSYSSVPIIMMTALVSDEDRLRGLEIGADDYICKPYNPQELIARVNAVLRRTYGGPDLKQGPLALNREKLRATYEGQEISITHIEFELLFLMASKPGRVYSRDEIMNNVYKDGRVINDRTVDTHISKLRKKLIDASPENNSLIHSVYGAGYKFDYRRQD